MEAKLSEFLRNGRDWEKKATSIPGIFIMKMPAYKSTPFVAPSRLCVELNPVDAEGRPTKKRGILLKSISELNNYKSILNDEKLANLITNIESINPRITKRQDEKEDIIEI